MATRKRKPKAVTSKVKFTKQQDEPAEPSMHTSGYMADELSKQMRYADSLGKSVKPQTIRKDVQKKYDRSKIAYSSREYYQTYDGIESKGWRRLSDSELREVAQVDPYISAIISTRCSQGAIIARPSDSKYDKGTRIAEIVPHTPDDFDTIELYQEAQAKRQAQMEAILKWFETCGTDDRDVLNAAFAGAEPTFKFCSLPEFVTAQVRNLMTFGRCGSQIFRNEENVPAFFRPVPIETIYHAAPGQDLHLGHREETSEQSIEDAEAYNAIVDEEERPHMYVQRVDGQNVNDLTEEQLKVWYFQKQALFDLNGYPLSPIEQAIYMVFIHQQTLGYLRNQFLKGLATKGILTLESTEPSAELSDEDVEQLRRDFHNFVTRTDNSAAVPVISGPVKVGFVQLSPNPNDMGFLQIEEHVVRALCSAFQISPQEMGYGHLSVGQGGMVQSNKQEEIVRGEERGLRMLLDVIYDGLNEILYENFPEAKELFRIVYTGVGEDTRDAATQRQVAELQTTATLSSLWADSEKTEPIAFGGNVPLAPAFHQFVVPKMTYGEFREYFFGEEGATKRPDFDFIIDPNLNQAYQQLKVTPVQVQQEQVQQQMEAGQQQQELAQQQSDQQQQQADAAGAVAGAGAGAPGQQGMPGTPGMTPDPDAQQPQEAAKSLRDEFNERRKLRKSMGTYFKHWVDANTH